MSDIISEIVHKLPLDVIKILREFTNIMPDNCTISEKVRVLNMKAFKIFNLMNAIIDYNAKPYLLNDSIRLNTIECNCIHLSYIYNAHHVKYNSCMLTPRDLTNIINDTNIHRYDILETSIIDNVTDISHIHTKEIITNNIHIDATLSNTDTLTCGHISFVPDTNFILSCKKIKIDRNAPLLSRYNADILEHLDAGSSVEFVDFRNFNKLTYLRIRSASLNACIAPPPMVNTFICYEFGSIYQNKLPDSCHTFEICKTDMSQLKTRAKNITMTMCQHIPEYEFPDVQMIFISSMNIDRFDVRSSIPIISIPAVDVIVCVPYVHYANEMDNHIHIFNMRIFPNVETLSLLNIYPQFNIMRRDHPLKMLKLSGRSGDNSITLSLSSNLFDFAPHALETIEIFNFIITSTDMKWPINCKKILFNECNFINGYDNYNLPVNAEIRRIQCI
jgi:hypothetical protein